MIDWPAGFSSALKEMIHSKSILVRIAPVVDTIVSFCFVCISSDITNWIAQFTNWEPEQGFSLFSMTPFLAGAAIMAVPFVLRFVGFYRRGNLQRTGTAIRQLFSFLVYYLCALACYQTLRQGSYLYMNHVIVVNMVGIPLALFLRFELFRWLQLNTSVANGRLRQILLVGTREDVDQGWESLPAYWKRCLHVAGKAVTGETTVEEIQAIIEKQHIEQLFLFGGISAYAANEKAVISCELQGIDVYVIPKDNNTVNLKACVVEVGDIRMLLLSASPEASLARMVKGIMDKVLALIGIIGTLPLWIIAAIGIKISDPKGKIFYRQERSGLYDKPFMMWKFRSMYADADKRLDEIKAKYGNEMNGPIFKLTHDPRVFPFGRFIRKFSIDELPQLINILLGDMSVVGPRPLPTYETRELPLISHRRRLSVKPGLTCYWQVEGRSDNSSFDDMIAKDLRYIDNWSLWLDFVLILRTFPAVLFGKGAK